MATPLAPYLQEPRESCWSAVLAVDGQGLIGRDGRLPWHFPADLAWFKRVTAGHPMLMGRRTHLAIGRALVGRPNWVLSTDDQFAPYAGAERFRDLAEVERRLNSEGRRELMVIGGAELWRQLWPRIGRVYLTRISRTLAPMAGDVRIPLTKWLADFEEIESPASGTADFTWSIWRRRAK